MLLQAYSVNGNTGDSKPPISGSSPDAPANFKILRVSSSMGEQRLCRYFDISEPFNVISCERLKNL